MRREKQTKTSIVYESTQKNKHKLNILGTLKLEDCMDINIIVRSYIRIFTLTKKNQKGQRPKCNVYYETEIFKQYIDCLHEFAQ